MPDPVSIALFAPLAAAHKEVLAFAYLDGSGRLVGVRHMAGQRGGVAPSLRVLAADALAFGAATAVCAHNHPSGDLAPSAQDLAFTRRLAAVFAALEVRLHDHLILTPAGHTSLREAGYL